MPCPSSTTSDEEIARNPHRPRGLWRYCPGFVVAAPRRWGSIDFVTASRIRTNGVRNGRYRGFPVGPPGSERWSVSSISFRLAFLSFQGRHPKLLAPGESDGDPVSGKASVHTIKPVLHLGISRGPA